MKGTSWKPTLFVAATALAAVFGAPAAAAAADCGADYITCIADDLGSSDALHETECIGNYQRCVYRRLLFF